MNLEQLEKQVEKVESGGMAALDVYATLKLAESKLDSLVKKVKQLAIEEAQKESEKTFERNGFRFSYTSGRANYDFKSDSVYVDYYTSLKNREKEMKEAAKAWERGKQIVDENGEIVPPAKVTYSADSLSVKPIK